LAAAKSGGSWRVKEEMGKEREIKLRVEDLAALRGLLRKIGARMVKPRVHERNVLFDTAKGTLAERDHLLRIRTETPVGRRGAANSRSVLTFKRPVLAPRGSRKGEAHKVREELELGISDHSALARVFEGLGMRRWFQYEKFRTTFGLPASNAWAKRLLIELDETPIGIFLELEGPARAIDRAAKALEFEKRDYVLENYMVLYREYCRARGEKPGDMLFAKSMAKRKRGGSRKKGKKFS
jgi:adenylate cyclase class 2